ncbi:MFS transporter [Sphingomonas sp. NIBR02145]|uniref:MFS transporter n=1 Tax=Sphingomonas sp. NIBR02145 TaxID=3014784 RepID=UPI0022B350A3|nr:MFS transporter [Sphingomonas sp. NIBR02145]WHU02123.1 MFS transporter [Sphingomonas sp. NIBR02145]
MSDPAVPIGETKSPSPLRWAILALLFASTVLNYVDRQTLSILAPMVQRDLGMNDIGYAHVVQLFLIAYTIAYLVAGWLTDKLGTRTALALFVGWWSLANMATGFVRSAGALGGARAMLGLGEAGNYTAGPKAVSEHFPPRERGFAFGTYTAGAMVGATIAPPLIGWLALTYGWREAFVATGAMGFVWLVAWLAIYPRRKEAREEVREPTPWRVILRERPLWGFAVSRMLADPVWYFYLFWFPKYLADQRELSLMTIAATAWIVYLAADIGSIGGGIFSGQLIKRGMTPPNSRLVGLGVAAVLAPVGMLISTNPGIEVTFALAALVAFAHLVFQINISTLVVDLYPTRVVATVFGIVAAGSGLGGIFSTQLVGRLAQSGNYGQIFLLMGCLHPLAMLIAFVALRSQPKSELRPG